MTLSRFKLLTFLLLLSSSVSVLGRSYPISNFNVLHVEGVMKVVLDQGAKPAMRVEATEEAEKSFVFKQEGEHVYLNTSNQTNWSGKKNIVVYLTVKTLEAVYFEGVGSLECVRELILPKLTVKAEGVGSVNIWVKANSMTASMEGMGKLKLQGTVQEANLSLEGAGKLDAFGLKAVNVKVRLEGVGKANVFCSNKLEASNEGIGSIRYRGNPRSVDKINSGMGSIKPDEE